MPCRSEYECIMFYKIQTKPVKKDFFQAVAARDALAKCLYGALFDWIVLQVNYSLISLKESANENNGNSIGVLDIFGFEDFGHCNR